MANENYCHPSNCTHCIPVLEEIFESMGLTPTLFECTWGDHTGHVLSDTHENTDCEFQRYPDEEE